MRLLLAIWLFASLGVMHGFEPGEIIINEVYFNTSGGPANDFEAVELLVITNGIDLNGLQVSDRNTWFKSTEDQCTLSDLGQGFLAAVPSGTLVVLYNGTGKDDTNASDFVLRFYIKSSLFCNAAPTGNGFQLNDRGDNLHLTYERQQIDFLQFGSSDETMPPLGEPGGLQWDRSGKGYIDVAPFRHNTGFRFIGDTAEMNDFIATWRVYSETVVEENNLGKPSPGRNAEWVKKLRATAKKPVARPPETVKPAPSSAVEPDK